MRSARAKPLETSASSFYSRCGDYAKSKGVTVHIVTIIGTECNINLITPVADLTNGEIERVNPKDLHSNFSEFLNKPVLATNVVLKVKLHKGLEFRNELHVSADRTVLSKDFGNVTADTDLTFEYQLKRVRELVKLGDVDLTQLKHLPF